MRMVYSTSCTTLFAISRPTAIRESVFKKKQSQRVGVDETPHPLISSHPDRLRCVFVFMCVCESGDHSF